MPPPLILLLYPLLASSQFCATVSLVAGSGSPTYTEGVGAAASFSSPAGLTYLRPPNASLVVADRANNRMRLLAVQPTNTTSLLCGATAGFSDGTSLVTARLNAPHDSAWVAPALFVADSSNHRTHSRSPPPDLMTRSRSREAISCGVGV